MQGMSVTEHWQMRDAVRHEPTDEDLLKLACTGKREGMEGLVSRYQQPLYRFLQRFLDSSEDAEQATLNVFIRAWEYAPRFQYRAKVSTWLFRIAVNLAHDMHTSRKRRPVLEEFPDEEKLTHSLMGNAEDEALEQIEREEQQLRLRKVLQSMNETDRLLLVLYYFEDRSYEEMHEISGLSYTVIKTRLSRARQKLRILLERAS